MSPSRWAFAWPTGGTVPGVGSASRMRRVSVALKETKHMGVCVHKSPLKSPAETGRGRPQAHTKQQPCEPHNGTLPGKWSLTPRRAAPCRGELSQKCRASSAESALTVQGGCPQSQCSVHPHRTQHKNRATLGHGTGFGGNRFSKVTSLERGNLFGCQAFSFTNC